MLNNSKHNILKRNVFIKISLQRETKSVLYFRSYKNLTPLEKLLRKASGSENITKACKKKKTIYKNHHGEVGGFRAMLADSAAVPSTQHLFVEITVVFTCKLYRKCDSSAALQFDTHSSSSRG